MDYKRIYESLTSRGATRHKLGDYTEKHHIVPKCMGGSDHQSNIAVLTAREHYIAHWLLTKIYPDDWKLYFAFFQMVKSHHHGRNINSRQFEKARVYLSTGAKMRYNLGLAPRKTDKGRKVLSDKMMGDNNPMRKYPEKNHTPRPHIVYFNDGSTRTYQYGKKGYEDLGISRSTWIYAVRMSKPIPKFGILKVEKL